MTPPTRAETEGDIEFYLGHGDEGVRDLAVTALALLSENKRLTSLAKHERDNRGEQTKNKRVTHDVLTGMLRTAEAERDAAEDHDLYLLGRVSDEANRAERAERVAFQAQEMAKEIAGYLRTAEARIAALEAVANSHMAALRAQAQDAANRVKQAEYIRDSTLSEPQDGEGGPRTAFSADATPEEVDAWIATRSSAPTSPPASPTDGDFQRATAPDPAHKHLPRIVGRAIGRTSPPDRADAMSEVLVAAERLARGCEEWGRVAKMPTEPCSCDVDEKPPFRKRHSADPGDAGYCMYYVNALYEEAHAEVAAALKAYRALSPAPTPAEGER